ncbi:MAG: hypothetical protein ACI8QC_001002 [Planctomycetota bacterium]|jgi:hypothetical protein
MKTIPSREHPGIQSRRGRLRTELPFAGLVAIALIYFLVRADVGEGGALVLADDEVCVLVDHRSGTQRVILEPGTHALLPVLQEVHRFSRRPFEYRMGGNEAKDDGAAPRLLVRARDGASYGFEWVLVQARLEPRAAGLVLEDSGSLERARMRIDSFARASLREAFGVFTTDEILIPSNRAAAAEAARVGLERRLERHGVQLLELTLSAPAFAPKYEAIITRRQVAEEDTARLQAQSVELRASLPGRLQELESLQALELSKLRNAGIKAMAAVELSTQRDLAKAQANAAERRQAGELERDTQLAVASRLEDQYRAEAAASTEQALRMAQWGPEIVRAALIEKLSGVRFEFQLRPQVTPVLGASAQGL